MKIKYEHKYKHEIYYIKLSSSLFLLKYKIYKKSGILSPFFSLRSQLLPPPSFKVAIFVRTLLFIGKEISWRLIFKRSDSLLLLLDASLKI